MQSEINMTQRNIIYSPNVQIFNIPHYLEIVKLQIKAKGFDLTFSGNNNNINPHPNL